MLPPSLLGCPARSLPPCGRAALRPGAPDGARRRTRLDRRLLVGAQTDVADGAARAGPGDTSMSGRGPVTARSAAGPPSAGTSWPCGSPEGCRAASGGRPRGGDGATGFLERDDQGFGAARRPGARAGAGRSWTLPGSRHLDRAGRGQAGRAAPGVARAGSARCFSVRAWRSRGPGLSGRGAAGCAAAGRSENRRDCLPPGRSQDGALHPARKRPSRRASASRSGQPPARAPDPLEDHPSGPHPGRPCTTVRRTPRP